MSKSVYEELVKTISSHTNSLTEEERNALKGLLYPSYPVNINFDRPIEHLISDGSFDGYDTTITSNTFPSNEKGQALANISLVSFNYSIRGKDVIGELTKMGLRSATLKELLALSIVYPKLQLAGPIISLGSESHFPNGGNYVPILDGYYSRRFLNLLHRGNDWGGNIRFAAVYVGIS